MTDDTTITQKPKLISEKKYILVAEDDAFYSQIFKTKLEKEGFDVIVVGDGVQTLEAVRERKPDLILLDMIMPVKDGFETLEELKADEKLKDIKVVVLSNLGQEEDIQRAKKLGASSYFVKSNLSIQEMVKHIKNFLGKS